MYNSGKIDENDSRAGQEGTWVQLAKSVKKN